MYAYRYEPERLRALADAYWRTVLLSTCILSIAAFIYGVWVLTDVLKQVEGAPAALSARPALPFDRAELREALRSFEDRAERLDAIARELGNVADPSR
jgi:hypothetical protein